MYEMYPDTWTAAEAAPAAKPRRRARKQHSVLPAVLVHLTVAAKIEPAAG